MGSFVLSVGDVSEDDREQATYTEEPEDSEDQAGIARPLVSLPGPLAGETPSAKGPGP